MATEANIQQWLTAIVAVALLVTLTSTLLLARRLNGSASYSTRIALVGWWLLSIISAYSATSFLWASSLEDLHLALVRLFPLAIRSASIVLAIALMGFYLRLYRRR